MITTYSLTPDGLSISQKLVKEYPAEYEIINNLVEKTREIKDDELNKIVKACFVMRSLLREFEERAASFSWQLSKESVREALPVLEKIGVSFLDLL